MRDFEKNKTLLKLIIMPKLDVKHEYAKMYEDAVQKEERNKDYQIHIKEKKQRTCKNERTLAKETLTNLRFEKRIERTSNGIK